MQLGMIGLGRMGAKHGPRLQKNGHNASSTTAARIREQLEGEGATGSASLVILFKKLQKPRAICSWFQRRLSIPRFTI